MLYTILTPTICRALKGKREPKESVEILAFQEPMESLARKDHVANGVSRVIQDHLENVDEREIVVRRANKVYRD